jgi:hypothetical protein
MIYAIDMAKKGRNPMKTKEILLTQNEVMILFGVDTETVRSWEQAGYLDTCITFGWRKRYLESSVRGLLADGNNPPQRSDYLTQEQVMALLRIDAQQLLSFKQSGMLMPAKKTWVQKIKHGSVDEYTQDSVKTALLYARDLKQ